MIDKPQRKPCAISYNWREVREYIEKKYSCDLRDFVDKNGKRHDFWHWILDQNHAICNGSVFHLRFDDLSTQRQWVQQIASYIIAEFPEAGGDDGLDLWVDW